MGLTTQKNYRLFLYINTLVIVLLGNALAVWAVFSMFPANLGEGYHNCFAVTQAIRKVLFGRVAFIYAVILLLIIAAIVVIHLFYSHRIAGPAYRIGREAAKIGGGDLTCNIKLRRKDNLTDMKDVLQDVGIQYGRRITAIKFALAIIEIQSTTVSDLIQQGKDKAELRQAADEITKYVNNIERSLSEVRT